MINGADTDTFCETKTARAFSWEMKHVCYPHIQTFTGLDCIVRCSSTGSLLHLPYGCTFFPPLIEDTTPSSPYSLLCLRISHHAVPQNHQYLPNGTHPQVGQRDEGVHKKQYAHIPLLYPFIRVLRHLEVSVQNYRQRTCGADGVRKFRDKRRLLGQHGTGFIGQSFQVVYSPSYPVIRRRLSYYGDKSQKVIPFQAPSNS